MNNIAVCVVEIQDLRKNLVWFRVQVTATLASGLLGVIAVPSVDQDCKTEADMWAECISSLFP